MTPAWHWVAQRAPARQGLPGSRQTVLRRVRDYQPTPEPAPRVIGIDDWAYRKGHRYGTIVVDLEQSCPADLLEDRLAETVATWLRAHPEVRVVARDRADTYASGVTRGAPDAVQVADRWHLLKNLREAVEVELCKRPILPWSPPLPGAASLPPAAPSGTPDAAAREDPPALHTPDAPEVPPGPAVVAQQVGVPPRTLRYWFARAGFPARKRRTGDRSSLAPYRVYYDLEGYCLTRRARGK